MINGLVDSLGDPGHTVFLTPDQVKSENEQLNGQITGIGVYLGDSGGGPFISSVISGSPAAKAGLKSGDRIIAIDGASAENLSNEEVSKLIRGAEGTPVSLTVIHPRSDAPVSVTIVRAKIDVPAVTWTMIPGTSLADIAISGFSADTGQQFTNALRGAKQAGATGVVLDLRNNPGGFVDEAVNVTSQLLGSGNVYIRKTADGEKIPVPVKPGGIATDMPVAVLVDYGTASSAEITSGALQDAKRAPIIGVRTYGTGTVLNNFALSDGSAVRLGVEEWLTPSGDAIFPERHPAGPGGRAEARHAGARPGYAARHERRRHPDLGRRAVAARDAGPAGAVTDAHRPTPVIDRVAAIDRAALVGRVERLQRELAARGLDAALLTERANVEYLTGIQLPPLWSSYTRILAVLVPANGEAVLLLPSFVANEAEDRGWRVESYATLERGAAELLAGFLERAGLGRGRIGIERGRESRLAATFGDLEALTDRLPGATLDDAMEAMWAVRSIKEPAEIDRLRVACAAASAAFEAAFAEQWHGRTEHEAAAAMQAGGIAGTAGTGAWVQLGWIGITSGPGSYDRFVAGPRDRGPRARRHALGGPRIHGRRLLVGLLPCRHRRRPDSATARPTATDRRGDGRGRRPGAAGRRRPPTSRGRCAPR